MKILLDTNFLYALNDRRDRNHARSVEFLRTCSASLLLPAPTLPEICYLLDSRLGHIAMRRFLSGLVASDIELVALVATDTTRVIEILAQYADARLDFADAATVAIAERINVARILTYDHRDFSILRPRHCDFFELLP